MSLIKSNKRNRLFPWDNAGLKNFLGTDVLFNDDFFAADSFMPAMNVKELDNEFEIEFAAPGFNKKDFIVTLDNNVLNVSCEKSKEELENEEGYTRKEFNYESFNRSLQLPDTVNSEKEIKATYKNGILKLNLLKKEEAKISHKKVIEIA